MALFADMPFPVQFFVAFVAMLGLSSTTVWAARRLDRPGASPDWQPRLAVIDYARIDGRRRLILVRLDNVEHLVMIGGPTDVVVESNIAAVTRQPAAARPRLSAPRPVPANLAENEPLHGRNEVVSLSLQPYDSMSHA
jgi:hypothetical protein